MSAVNQISRIILTVEGLTCERCATTAQKALKGVPGVTGASVDIATGQASIAFVSDEPSTDALVSALAARGYVAEVVPPNTANGVVRNSSLVTPNGCDRISFRVDSLVATAEMRALRIALAREPGVRNAGTHRRSDDSNEGIAWAVYDPEKTNAGRMRTVIQERGYKLR